MEPYGLWRRALQAEDLASNGYFATFTQCRATGSRFDVGHHVLNFRIAVQDDEASYYDSFIDWLALYSDTEGFVGYSYEYDSGDLSLWRFQSGIAYRSDADWFV